MSGSNPRSSSVCDHCNSRRLFSLLAARTAVKNWVKCILFTYHTPFFNWPSQSYQLSKTFRFLAHPVYWCKAQLGPFLRLLSTKCKTGHLPYPASVLRKEVQHDNNIIYNYAAPNCGQENVYPWNVYSSFPAADINDGKAFQAQRNSCRRRSCHVYRFRLNVNAVSDAGSSLLPT